MKMLNKNNATNEFQSNCTESVSRRGMLSIMSVATAVAATGASALQTPGTPTHDPIPEWFAQWKKQNDFLNDRGVKMSEADATAAIFANDDLAVRIVTTRARTAEGAACQIELAIEDGFLEGGYADGRELLMAKNIIAFLRGGHIQ